MLMETRIERATEPLPFAAGLRAQIAAMRDAGRARDPIYLLLLDSLRRDAQACGMTVAASIASACEQSAARVNGRLCPGALACWCDALEEAMTLDLSPQPGGAGRASEVLLASVAMRLRV